MTLRHEQTVILMTDTNFTSTSTYKFFTNISSPAGTKIKATTIDINQWRRFDQSILRIKSLNNERNIEVAIPINPIDNPLNAPGTLPISKAFDVPIA